ncbi:MAG: universal stress protein [Pseudomonadota bacterium]
MMKTITCCVDFSENAGKAFERALEISQKFKARLLVIHVLPPVVNPLAADGEWVVPEERDKSWVLKVEERLQEDYGSRIPGDTEFELVVLDGHVSSEIIEFLKKSKSDLVIMGSYGTSGVGLVIFGSVAKRVAHRAPCSVMIVR